VVVIETGSGDGSRAVETVGAGFEGADGFTIAFKPHYLLDGVVAAASGTSAAADAASAHGDASADGDAKAHGDPGTAAAARAGSGGSVTIAFTSPEKPAVITGGPGFRYLIAPMRT
jgi:DNA polymerase III sliding clamp (beta) subunit (PCNA family)